MDAILKQKEYGLKTSKQNNMNPLIQNGKSIQVSSISKEKLMLNWSNAYKLDVARLLDNCNEITKNKCLESGLYFYLPKSCEGDKEFYSQLSNYDWYYPNWKWEHQLALDLCAGEKVLEIGCGFGEFLSRLGKVTEPHVGLELNPKCSAFNEGFIIKNQPLMDFNSQNNSKFDVVCAFQVLEHVSNPRDFINECIKATKENGLIIFGTPDSNSFIKYSFNLLDMPPHHMTCWNKSAYLYLEKLFPLKLVRLEYEPLADYHVDYYVSVIISRFLKKIVFGKYSSNNRMYKIIRTCVKIFQKHIRGQSILAVFKRLPDSK